jgi:YHS domain-containing protein
MLGRTYLKTLASIAAALLFSATLLVAGGPVNVSGASRIALDGYDPVAFFTDSKPVHGSPTITAEHRGAIYLFASEAHRKAFAAAPEKYLPQYGGFCAYGASLGALFPVDISTWQIRDGKLYLNLNPEILAAFNQDFAGSVRKADAAWPGLARQARR